MCALIVEQAAIATAFMSPNNIIEFRSCDLFKWQRPCSAAILIGYENAAARVVVERRGRMARMSGLSTRGSWVRIPAKARRGICEQDTLNPQLGVAIISRIACGTPNVIKKKKKKILADWLTEMDQILFG
jgi:hypothetical protein